MQVISAQTIAHSGARDLAELLQREGGVYVTPLAGRGTSIEIQGLSSDQVLILVDGRRMIGRIFGGIDLTRLRLDSIERIEIVKGPSSALYGADALGGVVNLISKRDGSGGVLSTRHDTLGDHDVQGTKGSASLTPFRVFKELHGAPVDVTPTGAVGREHQFTQSYRSEWAYFAAGVRGEVTLAPPEDQLRLHKVVEAIYKSADEQRDVKL